MKTISLNGKWKLAGKRQNCENAKLVSITATVPGCVQLDLSAHGYLPEDIYMGENVLAAEEFEDSKMAVWFLKENMGNTEQITKITGDNLYGYYKVYKQCD